MRLRTRFFLFAAFIHVIMALLAIFLFQYNKLYFLLSEGLIIISIFITIGLYRSFVKPLNIMAAGMESLKEKDFSIKFVNTGQYEIDQLIEVYNKMIEQLREERIEVNEQHYFLEKLIKASPSGILILDYDNKIQSANPAALEILRLPSRDLLGKNPEEIPGSISLNVVSLASKKSVIVHGNGFKTYRCKIGQFIHKGFQQHFIIMEELTTELLQAEKKAYEKVIRMMSHEINNTVGAVNSMLGSVKKVNFSDGDEYGQILQVCIDRNRRMAKFMSNFANVVKLPEVKKEVNDLHDVIKNVSVLFSDVCEKRKIKIKSFLDGDVFHLAFDAPQMEQVLINIIKNSIESIDEKGQIQIITNKNDNRLIIRDSGKGIDNLVKDKLFSPFYSNKKEGQGIGLTLTKEILHNHNYTFSLDTKKEGVTEFVINFSANSSLVS